MGVEPNAAGDFPQVAPSAYVHPSAILIGNVQIRDKVFVGPQAVIRADEPDPGGAVAPVIIGEGSNVQDCAEIHALGERDNRAEDLHCTRRDRLAGSILVSMSALTFVQIRMYNAYGMPIPTGCSLPRKVVEHLATWRVG